MASLDQIITVDVTRVGTTVSQVGFGTANLVGFFPTSVFPERSRTFSSLTGLTDVGFTVSDPIYAMASSLLAQNPSPSSFKVGRRIGAPQQVLEITPTEVEVGAVHTVTIAGYADSAFASRASVTDTATYTVITSDTATDICDGLRTDLTPTGDYSEGGTATLTLTADNTTMDGLLFGVTYTVNSVAVGVDDNTPNPAVKIATDLAAIDLYDNDWYALALDSNSSDEITGAATAAEGAAKWVESNDNPKILVCQTQDPAVADVDEDTDTTSVAALLVTAGYDNTMLFYHTNNMDRVDTAMLGVALPSDPGSINWAYQSLSSVSAQSLTTNQMSNLMGLIGNPTGGKNVNTLTALAGNNITRYGRVSSGEWIDNIRYSAFLASRIQERTFGIMVSNGKIAYTDAGLQMIRGEVIAQMDAGIVVGALASDPAPTCTVPLASTVSAANRANRLVDNITFRATLASAVNYVAISGELVI
jgi:hypothetical protein